MKTTVEERQHPDELWKSDTEPGMPTESRSRQRNEGPEVGEPSTAHAEDRGSEGGLQEGERAAQTGAAEEMAAEEAARWTRRTAAEVIRP